MAAFLTYFLLGMLAGIALLSDSKSPHKLDTRCITRNNIYTRYIRNYEIRNTLRDNYDIFIFGSQLEGGQFSRDYYWFLAPFGHESIYHAIQEMHSFLNFLKRIDSRN